MKNVEKCTKLSQIHPSIIGNTFKKSQNFAQGDGVISHRFAKILFPLWNESRYLYLEIYQNDFPTNLWTWSTRLGVLLCRVSQKFNTCIFWKMAKSKKVVFFGYFVRESSFSQVACVKNFLNFFQEETGSRYVLH